MVRITSLLLLTLLAPFSLLAIYDSTLYSSHFEAQLFAKIQDSAEVNPVDIMLAVNYIPGDEEFVNKNIEKIITALKEDGIEGKKTKKQIQERYISLFIRKS